MNRTVVDSPLQDENARRPGFAATIRAELSQIEADPIFQNSPTLAKLLRFLVDETLAGRGERLKAYSIAVDGLGREADFDAQSDSYPRVQVGRLRKSLATYYAQHAPEAELCLYLQSGSYLVRLGRLATAYPELFRPLSADATKAEGEYSTAADVAFKTKRTATIQTTLISGLVIAFIVIMALLVLKPPAIRSPTKILFPDRTGIPTILLTPITVTPGTKAAALAQNAFAFFADGLSRSWVANVNTNTSIQDAGQIRRIPNAYRLDGQLDDNGDGTYTYFSRLTDADDGMVIWSTTQRIAPRGGNLSAELAPLVSRISGPYGALAQRQRENIGTRFDPGYPCLIQFTAYWDSPDPGFRQKLASCLAVPVREVRLESVRLAYRSTYALYAGNVGLDRRGAVRLSLDYAKAAVEADHNEAFAQFTYARAAYVANDCKTGRDHARAAFTGNPYDPIILAVLGGLSLQCGQQEGLAMLDQAYQIYDSSASYVRLPLIMDQIRQKRFDRLPRLSETAVRQSTAGRAYYYLCETLISAALDHAEDAAKYWAAFVATQSKSGRSNDEMLYTIIYSDETRARILAFLERKHVIQTSITADPLSTKTATSPM